LLAINQQNGRLTAGGHQFDPFRTGLPHLQQVLLALDKQYGTVSEQANDTHIHPGSNRGLMQGGSQH
jgi:hypothetical protein